MPNAATQSHTSNNLRKWEYSGTLYQRVLTAYLDRLYALLASTGARTVLDAGCGEGVVYRAMRERGFQGSWTGVDLSPGAVDFARERSPESTWEVGSLVALPYAPRSFDWVLSSQVLEHIPSPEAARDGIARVAGVGLLVTVPWEPLFRALVSLSIRAGVGEDPGHVNFWTGAAFRAFLAPAGRLTHWERSTVYQLALVSTAR